MVQAIGRMCVIPPTPSALSSSSLHRRPSHLLGLRDRPLHMRALRLGAGRASHSEPVRVDPLVARRALPAIAAAACRGPASALLGGRVLTHAAPPFAEPRTPTLYTK